MPEDLHPPRADSGQRMTVYLPSSIEYLAVVDKMVDGVAEILEMGEEENIAVATSLIEACTNAIQHGHQEQADKLFCCSFYLGEDRLVVTVKDRGPGFDVDRVLQGDPTRPARLLDARGRGIFIMRAMMDTVEFEIRKPEGTTVHLTKRLHRRRRGA